MSPRARATAFQGLATDSIAQQHSMESDMSPSGRARAPPPHSDFGDATDSPKDIEAGGGGRSVRAEIS